MPTPMPSASNSCAREKLASAILDFASASAPISGSLSTSLHDAAHQRDLARLVLADRGVARDHVRHLVREHRGELGGVVGERDQAARDVELAARQREGVDRRRIEDGDAVVQVRPLGRRDQLVDGLVEQRFELGILVGAVIGGEDALMLALVGRRPLLLRLPAAASGSDPGGAPTVSSDELQPASSEAEGGDEQQPATRTARRRKRERPECSVPTAMRLTMAIFCGSVSSARRSRSAPGGVASIRGPLRSSIHPRTRTRRFSSLFGASPAAAKMRSWRFKMVTVSACDHRRPKFT